jgi:hypothetical protein
MSDKPQVGGPVPDRALRREEEDVIRSLLAAADGTASLQQELAGARVTDMNDGGMGSVRFTGPNSLSLGRF